MHKRRKTGDVAEADAWKFIMSVFAAVTFLVAGWTLFVLFSDNADLRHERGGQTDTAPPGKGRAPPKS